MAAKRTELTALPAVNNEVYSALGERWYGAADDPIALLRAESRLRNPWLAERLTRSFGSEPCRVLDVGCGGGFLANDLAARGHRVVGIDASEDALAVARLHDSSGSVRYERGDALSLPFANESFDVVCAMDFLEHVEQPERVISEAARVLRPGGLFFFHTFNRNFLAWLIVIKGVEWFVRNTPRHLHVLRLFLRPSEVSAACERHALGAPELLGMRPRLNRAFFRMLLTGRVSSEFQFELTRSTRLAYLGVSRKQ